MSSEIDFDELLKKYKSDPFDYVDIFAVHTGRVSFRVIEGAEVQAPGGEWQQIPGTPLYEINRERNPKGVAAQTNGTVSMIRTELDGQFVEAGEKLMTIRHPLKKRRSSKISSKRCFRCFPRRSQPSTFSPWMFSRGSTRRGQRR